MISVCLATYNGDKYIKAQLNSILCQLSDKDELIISDDGSSDNTIPIINDIDDERIVLIINKGIHGFTGNFENAINHSKGEVIFLSDQDDIWNKSKVELSLKALQGADLVVSDAEIVDEELNQMNPSHFNLYKVKTGFLNNFVSTRYIGACMAFRREVLEKALPIPKQHKYCQHDWWLAIIAEYYYRVKIIETPLIKYRRHGTNASTGGTQSNNSIYKVLYTRIYSFYNLLRR